MLQLQMEKYGYEVEEDTYFDDEDDELFYTILQPKINPFELIEYSSIKE